MFGKSKRVFVDGLASSEEYDPINAFLQYSQHLIESKSFPI